MPRQGRVHRGGQAVCLGIGFAQGQVVKAKLAGDLALNILLKGLARDMGDNLAGQGGSIIGIGRKGSRFPHPFGAFLAQIGGKGPHPAWVLLEQLTQGAIFKAGGMGHQVPH